MSDETSGGGEKSFEPTEQRLRDARAKGDIPRLAEVNTAVAYIGLALAATLAGPELAARVGTVLVTALDRASELAPVLLGPGGPGLAWRLLGDLATGLAPLFLAPPVAVLLALAAQRAVIFSPEKIRPKMSRVSLLKVAAQKFGPSGLFEFAKNLLKLVAISVVMALFLRANFSEIIGSIRGDGATISALIGRDILRFLWLTALIAIAISAADAIWQRFDHRRKLRMSRQDVTEETRRQEGDPQLKQARRQRGQDIATQRMMVEVAQADVVIVNPQHFAVALRWRRKQDAAPICVAKGVDEAAARIRARAAEAGVPVHRDPPTARALFATVELGSEVRPEHYHPVAAAIRYAERARSLSRKGSRQ